MPYSFSLLPYFFSIRETLNDESQQIWKSSTVPFAHYVCQLGPTSLT